MKKLKQEAKNVTDPRRIPFGNIRHNLEAILVIKGAVITIDAMGCQRTIAAAIIAKAAD